MAVERGEGAEEGEEMLGGTVSSYRAVVVTFSGGKQPSVVNRGSQLVGVGYWSNPSFRGKWQHVMNC